MDDTETSLLAHLEALRSVLIRIFAAVAILYIPAYFAAPRIIDLLVARSFPAGTAQLHYFAPMEVFIIQLKLALVIALTASYPWNIHQIWTFLAPALYPGERRMLGWWIFFSAVLFFAGVIFCAALVLPLIMRFSLSFATNGVQPMLGIASFLGLAGWMSLSFGIVFQAPLAVMLAVRFHIVRASTLSKCRPYVYTVILIMAALLTPPDVVSQLMLAIPTALLFEIGLFFARRLDKRGSVSQ